MGTGGGGDSLGTAPAAGLAISGLAPKPLEGALPLALAVGSQADQDKRLLALAKGKEVRLLAAQPGTAVYICRRDGHILWASPSFAQVFGHRAQDLVGRNAWEIFPAREDLQQGAEASAKLNEGDIIVWLLLKLADGRKDWFRVEALNREGGVVLTFRVETNPAQRRFHVQGRGSVAG